MEQVKRFVRTDAKGFALAFFASDAKAEIPPDAFEITEAQWKEWVTQGKGRQWRNGKLTTTPAPAGPPPVIRTLKSDVWRRCTDEEAEQLDARLAASPARLRRLWADSTILESNAPEYQLVRAAIAEELGEDRAAEILAAS